MTQPPVFQLQRKVDLFQARRQIAQVKTEVSKMLADVRSYKPLVESQLPNETFLSGQTGRQNYAVNDITRAAAKLHTLERHLDMLERMASILPGKNFFIVNSAVGAFLGAGLDATGHTSHIFVALTSSVLLVNATSWIARTITMKSRLEQKATEILGDIDYNFRPDKSMHGWLMVSNTAMGIQKTANATYIAICMELSNMGVDLSQAKPVYGAPEPPANPGWSVPLIY